EGKPSFSAMQAIFFGLPERAGESLAENFETDIQNARRTRTSGTYSARSSRVLPRYREKEW
ncbi:MAG: hypothetical protein J6V07_05270, partial [Clostridia bacterium]|nr:hypothetical protein [Clostridia bacterium]